MSNDENPNIVVSDAEATIAKLIAEIAEVKAKSAEYEAMEMRRREEKELEEKIEAESRFRQARNTLALRRIKPEELVSAREVFDFLEVVDKKKAAGGSVKRIYVSNREFKAYRTLKEQGNSVAEITLDMIKAVIKNSGKAVEEDEADALDEETM
jgi:DNA-binding protein H-NS